jgi:excinuclease UvrABC nuclease subunit
MNVEIKKIIKKNKIDVIYIDENINIKDISKIPDYFGTYIITTESGKRYIGSTFDIRCRIYNHKNHVNTPIIEPIKNLVAYVTDSKRDAKLLEAKMIYELKPELNTRGKDREIDVIWARKQ